MFMNIDLSYLLAIQSLTSDELSFRRDQLIELHTKMRQEIMSISSDGLALLRKRIETVELALAIKVSEHDLVPQAVPAPQRSSKIVSGWAQQLEHFDAAAAFNIPAPSPKATVLKGGAQHDVDYPVVVAFKDVATAA